MGLFKGLALTKQAHSGTLVCHDSPDQKFSPYSLSTVQRNPLWILALGLFYGIMRSLAQPKTVAGRRETRVIYRMHHL